MRKLVAVQAVVTALVDEGAVITSLVAEVTDQCAGCGHLTSG